MRYGMRPGRVWEKYVPASLTIEAALLVPLLLAILFLLLQMVLFLHDTVIVETWLYQETWKRCRSEEQKAAGLGSEEAWLESEEAPKLAVLRHVSSDVTEKWNLWQQESVFDVCLLPEFVTVILQGQPRQTVKQAAERERHPWQFVRIAGAILEEWEERNP